ncbi:DSS1/SEM1 family protein [Rhodotorula toruloides]|uniref:26S proteasome complex subunit SEM1 n=1 Tax=Rhodotorula toruloides TaxID=5286 RepID=A0A0K3C6F4_RHOTO|nr:DSS1/SEM1 family protein [Rhodotorula toruloides]
MASTAAPTASAPTTTAQAAPKPSNANPHLLPLQEDDEFEEFPAEDWDIKESYGAHLAKKANGAASAQGGAGAQGGEGSKALDSLWEDDWDDDDVGDDFSVQLRGELLKQQDQMQA